MDNAQEQKFQRMTQTPVKKLVCQLAVPTIISMLVTSFYNMADTFFVGMLQNASATAGVGIVYPLMAIIQDVYKRQDMRGPIGYAMAYPSRLPYGAEPLDFAQLGKLTFEAPDTGRFPSLAMAYAALRTGGSAPVALNGANEAAVAAFLREEIPFGRMSEVSEETLNLCPVRGIAGIGDVYAVDAQARAIAEKIIRRRSC